jgi:flagellar biosynthesis/type III secretory pathway protein FliH
LLAKLQLDPARRALISGFVDSYLRLTIDEERVFEEELQKVEPVQQERVMEIVTSWMQQGIEQGIGQGIEIGREEGKQKEALSLICRMLHKQLGTLEPELETRIAELPLEQLEGLAEALLDFASLSDLKKWLDD